MLCYFCCYISYQIGCRSILHSSDIMSLCDTLDPSLSWLSNPSRRKTSIKSVRKAYLGGYLLKYRSSIYEKSHIFKFLFHSNKSIPRVGHIICKKDSRLKVWITFITCIPSIEFIYERSWKCYFSLDMYIFSFFSLSV